MEYKDKLHRRIGSAARFATNSEAQAIETWCERIQNAQTSIIDMRRKIDQVMYKIKLRSGELRRREDHPNNQKKEVPENAEAKMARLFKSIKRNTNTNHGDTEP